MIHPLDKEFDTFPPAIQRKVSIYNYNYKTLFKVLELLNLSSLVYPILVIIIRSLLLNES